jgi:hypothetical protein
MTARFTPLRPTYGPERPAEFATSTLGSLSPPQTNGPFRVVYDLYLGQYGAYCASMILQTCLGDLNSLEQIFGIAPPAGTVFDVVLTAANDGASHPSCIATQISIGALTDPNGNAPLLRALLVAELAEVFMAALNNGWLCTANHGEGLSRVLAEEICPGAIPPWLCCARAWLDSSRPNYVDATYPSDTELVPVGCAILFLYWLRYQIGYDWQRIVAAGGATLEQTYSGLTGGRTDGSAYFYDLVNRSYPPGTPSNLPFDNIFPIRADAPQIEAAPAPAAAEVPAMAAGQPGFRPPTLPPDMVGTQPSLVPPKASANKKPADAYAVPLWPIVGAAVSARRSASPSTTASRKSSTRKRKRLA